MNIFQPLEQFEIYPIYDNGYGFFHSHLYKYFMFYMAFAEYQGAKSSLSNAFKTEYNLLKVKPRINNTISECNNIYLDCNKSNFKEFIDCLKMVPYCEKYLSMNSECFNQSINLQVNTMLYVDGVKIENEFVEYVLPILSPWVTASYEDVLRAGFEFDKCQQVSNKCNEIILEFWTKKNLEYNSTKIECNMLNLGCNSPKLDCYDSRVGCNSCKTVVQYEMYRKGNKMIYEVDLDLYEFSDEYNPFIEPFGCPDKFNVINTFDVVGLTAYKKVVKQVAIPYSYKYSVLLDDENLITNSDLYWYLTLFIITFFFFEFGMYKIFILPLTVMQYISEFFYNFIYNLIFQQVGKKGEEYFPLIFSIFFLILFSNIIGLMPYGFTNTSSLIQTLWLSCTCLIGLTILGFYRQGLNFLKLFLPSGVPLLLMPLLIMIEVVSYLIRPISLGVRLFANMMSGHALLNILSGFVLTLAKKNLFFALFPFMVVLAISFLEFGIAFLQAYVFVVLLCMYLNDSFNASH